MSYSYRLRALSFVSLFSTAALPGFAADAHAPAVFDLTEDVLQSAVPAFTATVPSFGNALVGHSFEPAHFRTRLFVSADAADRIIADNLDHYDSYREGFYDGADVRVYRIVDGAFRLVRRDRVAANGSAMSGWRGATPKGKLIPAATAADGFSVAFDAWNRPNAPYYFSVTAVAPDGTESPKSEAVACVRPEGKASQKAPAAALQEFKPAAAQDAAKPPAAPTGLKADFDEAAFSVRLTWTAPEGDVAGYRLYRSDYPPEEHRGEYLLLEGGADVAEEARLRKGDMVVLAKEFRTFSRNRFHSNRVWDSHENKAGMPAGLPFFPDENPAATWELVPHAPDTPVEDAGETCAKFTLGEGGKVAFDEYNHGPTGQTWYPVLEPGVPYVVEFWARQEGMADPAATFKLNGFYRKTVDPVVFPLESEWRHFKATFTVPSLYEGDSGVGQTSLSFQGPGTVWIDNYRVYSSRADYLDYLPKEYEDLKDSGMGRLRTHAFIKTGVKTYSMGQFTNPAGAIHGVSKGNTLPQTLSMMRTAGVLPWLQVEFHMSPEEWLGLVEYLAAPYDPQKDTPKAKPWAYKRFRQGQTAPWTDEFPDFFFEIGNETWNWLFDPWVFEGMTDASTGQKYSRGQVYGLFQEYVIDQLRASPYWTDELDRKIRFVLGGWSVQKYGLAAATTSPRSTLVTRAAYNGGWDEGEGPSEGNDESLYRALMQAGQSALPEAEAFRAARDEQNAGRASAGGRLFDIGTYEAGPGYALSGLNGQARMTPEQVRAQEETMKSLGAGTATLDTFLGRAAAGYTSQNFFTYFHGRTHWVSHADLMKGAQPYPCWMTLALFNREVAGADMLRVTAESVPTADLPAYRRRKGAENVPLATCYAFRKGDRVCLFVLSRKLDGYPEAGDDGFTPVTARLPFRSASSVTLHRMVGDPRTHNLDGESVRIERIALPANVAKTEFSVDATTGADARGLPPGATFLYVFEGVK